MPIQEAGAVLTEEQFCFNAFWWENLNSEGAVREVVDGLAAIGYRAVEWKETSFEGGAKLAEGFEWAARVSRGAGLDVSDFVILRDISDPDQDLSSNVEDVKDAIRAAAGAGVDKLNIVTGAAPKEAASGEWFVPPADCEARGWETLTRSLEELLAVAEKEKLRLVLEACVGNLVHDYFSTLELFRRVDSDYLCLTLDPSHYLLYRNDLPYAVSQLKNKVKHVHLKDSAGRPGVFGKDFLFPILGEGAIDWLKFFRALDDTGYGGYLSVEFESFKYMHEVLHNDYLKAARLSKESLDCLFTAYKESISQ